MDRFSGYASNCRMNIDKNARISIIASERPGQSVEPPPNGRKSARGISGFPSPVPDWKRLGSKLDASGPQTCRSLCTTAAGICISDPALSRYWPSRRVSSVVQRADNEVEYMRSVSLTVDPRSGHELCNCEIGSRTSVEPPLPRLFLLSTKANSSDRKSWSSFGSDKICHRVQRREGTIFTKRPMHVVISKRPWSS